MKKISQALAKSAKIVYNINMLLKYVHKKVLFNKMADIAVVKIKPMSH